MLSILSFVFLLVGLWSDCVSRGGEGGGGVGVGVWGGGECGGLWRYEWGKREIPPS